MKIKAQFFSLRFGPTDIDVLRELIKTAAKSGMNMVCIEVENGLRYDSHPEISAPWALSKEDLRGVVALAKKLGIELVPLLPCFSHVNYVLKQHPEFRESEHVDICCPKHPAVSPIF